MNTTDVLVIGSSAAGLVTALTARRVYPGKKIVVTTTQEKTLIPCGIPYIFGTVQSSDKDILPADKMFEANNIDMIVDEAELIDLDSKTVKYASGKVIGYEKLVIGTGSTPNKPKWLKGADYPNVFTVPKNKTYLDKMQQTLAEHKKIVVIGAGFIGVEISDELKKSGKEVTLIEKQSYVLPLAFDVDVAEPAGKLLQERGVKVLTGQGISEIVGNGKANGVKLENGEVLEADAVILAMGYKPNSQLAQKSGISTTPKGYIKVDDYLRTEHPDVFAVGDCAEKTRFFYTKTQPDYVGIHCLCRGSRGRNESIQIVGYQKLYRNHFYFFNSFGRHWFWCCWNYRGAS